MTMVDGVTAFEMNGDGMITIKPDSTVKVTKVTLVNPSLRALLFQSSSLLLNSIVVSNITTKRGEKMEKRREARNYETL